jgi:protein SCO1/2
MMTDPSSFLRGERHRWLVSSAVGATLLLAACGSSDSGSSSGSSVDVQEEGSQEIGDVSPDRVLAGIVREPSPVVDETPIPSLTNEGDDVVFRAQSGGLQVVYFGYTNCPDVCPTTMFDHTVSLRLLPDDMAEQVDTVMVTVDPDRDLELLTGYVQSFVPDGEAAGTADPAVLEAAAEPFGVGYDVVEASDGSIEVSHSGFLYVVGDNGELLLAWPFGTSSEEMAADMFQLLSSAATS